MTPKQARFVQEYLVDGNGTAAAIRAGYAAAGAHVTASRTLRDPKVAEAIREGQAETRAALKIDQKAVIAALQAAYDLARARSEPSAMVAAAREIGRLLGLYAPEQRTIIATHPASAAALRRFEAMTDEELMALISEASSAV